MRNNREKRTLGIVTLFWIILISGLAWWNVRQIREADQEKNLEAARSLFDARVEFPSGGSICSCFR